MSFETEFTFYLCLSLCLRGSLGLLLCFVHCAKDKPACLFVNWVWSIFHGALLHRKWWEGDKYSVGLIYWRKTRGLVWAQRFCWCTASTRVVVPVAIVCLCECLRRVGRRGLSKAFKSHIVIELPTCISVLTGCQGHENVLDWKSSGCVYRQYGWGHSDVSRDPQLFQFVIVSLIYCLEANQQTSGWNINITQKCQTKWTKLCACTFCYYTFKTMWMK